MEARRYKDNYNADSMTKPVGVILSKKALEKLDRQAREMGLKRSELIRQVLHNQAFKETLAV